MALVKDSIGLLEAQNPVPSPTDRFDLLAGNWEVLFTSTKVTVCYHRTDLAIKSFSVRGQQLVLWHSAQSAVLLVFTLFNITLKIRVTAGMQGSRRVKLGLRDMVHISHISQEIDVAAKCAVRLSLNPRPSALHDHLTDFMNWTSGDMGSESSYRWNPIHPIHCMHCVWDEFSSTNIAAI